MEKITASWSVELNVTCPNCEDYFNIIPEIGYDYELLPKVFESDENANIQVQCPNCTETFNIDEIEH